MKKSTGIIASLCAAVLAGGVALLKYLNDRESPKYSDKWMSSLSDSDLDIEREKVRQAFCSSGEDFSTAVRLESILNQFDKEICNRESDDSSDYIEPRYTEHGWHLPEDD